MKCPFDLTNKNQVIEFEEIDPYNPQNTVKGFINRRQGQLYGALWITHINNKKCPQLIYSAPKQHYPFDKEKKDYEYKTYAIARKKRDEEKIEEKWNKYGKLL